MGTEFGWTYDTWEFGEIQSAYELSRLRHNSVSGGDDSLEKLLFPFRPELTSNTERGQWYFQNDKERYHIFSYVTSLY